MPLYSLSGRAKDWTMKHFRKRLSGLPHDVGISQEDGSRSSDGRHGYISYGPYILIEPGRYFGGFNVRRLASPDNAAELTIDIASHAPAGVKELASRVIPISEVLPDLAGLVGVEFSTTETPNTVEVRLHVSRTAEVNVTELVLFQL